MKEIIQSPKQFNLQHGQFDSLDDWTPYKTDEQPLILARRASPGTLMPSQELRGVGVMRQLPPERFESTHSQRYMRDIIARTGISSASYDLDVDERMFSTLQLGRVAEGQRTPESELRYVSPEEFAARTDAYFAGAEAAAANRIAALKGSDGELAFGFRRKAGRHIGNAALSTLVYDMPGHMEHLHPVDVQLMVRERTLTLLGEVAEYAHDIGARPSVAQLVEPDSPVAVDIRRHAPRDVRRAYEATATQFPEQRAA